MSRLLCIMPLLILLAASCAGCQNLYLLPGDIGAIEPPAVRLDGRAGIKLETGEVVSDRYPAKGFGAADQAAFVTRLQEELEASHAFRSVGLTGDAASDYLFEVLFHRTEASGGGFEAIYNLDVELRISDHGQLSLIRRYGVLTPENRLWAFFADTTIRAGKARAANELHRCMMEDINGWLLGEGGKSR